MPKIFKVAFVLLALLAALFGFIIYRFQPLQEGTIELATATGKADIHIDSRGVPHIFAETEEMAVYAQGFMHARDRLFQMTRMRRFAQGRVSEIAGGMTLDIDVFMRTLGLEEAASKAVKHASPDFLAQLKSYADGVNAYLESGTPSLEAFLSS